MPVKDLIHDEPQVPGKSPRWRDATDQQATTPRTYDAQSLQGALMSRVTVLGSVKSRSEESQWETLAPSARQLLAIMVAAGPDGLSFERVADELWPNDLPATWDASLRMALTRLRKRLPTGSLTSRSRWCRLELPAEAVDVWHLAALAKEPAANLDADALVDQITQEAFPSVEVSPLIRQAIDEFDLQRLLLLDRLIKQGTSISPMAAVRLRSFAASRDWDTTLGERAEQISRNAQRGTRASLTASTATDLPPSLARHRAPRLLGREAAVERLTTLAADATEPVVMLAGQPKSGRSATLAEAGARLAASGWRIVHLEPCVPTAAFGPFLQALPDLRAPLLAALTSGASDAQIRSRCWVSILQALDHSDVPTCVIVDDLELLDSNSEEALAFVGRGRTANVFAILIAADPDHAAIASSDWLKAPRVPLDPLAIDALWELIADIHPNSTDLQRLQLSNQISTLAGGLAGQAAQLAQAADPETLTLPPLISSGDDAVAASLNVSDEALAVAVAASIIRAPISLDQLEHVTRSDSHRVLTAVDELLGIGFLTETSRPDAFELAPTHQHGDVTSALLPHEVARFSRRAMTLPGRNPVTLAADALRARPLVTDGDAVKALLAAIDSLVASQSHREAVANFQAAEELGAELSVRRLVTYATSLELIGADSTEIRERAIALAVATGEAGLALDAALAGLPRAEQVDGDAARADLIASIDPASLSRGDQLRRHLELSRQLLLLSRRDDAMQEAKAAAALVETVDEEADVWLATAHINQWSPIKSRAGGFEVARFGARDQVGDERRKARLHQASVVSAMTAGDFASAAMELEALIAAADKSEDPLRIWHAMLLRCCKLTNELRLDEAEQMAEVARNHGVSFGLGAAIASRVAQRWNRATLLGDMNNTVGQFETAPPKAMQSLLARAATCPQLNRLGRSAEALDVAERVLADATGSRFELAVAGLLSGGVDRTAPAVQARIAEILEPHRGMLLMAGAGVTVQGPIESLLANVAVDDATALDLRNSAVELVDTWQSPLWQIVTRIQLGLEHRRIGQAADEQKYLSEAADRAAGTQFATYERWGLFTS